MFNTLINALMVPVNAKYLREAKELHAKLSDDLWEEGLPSTQSCAIKSSHTFIQFKDLHRLHYEETGPPGSLHLLESGCCATS